MPTTLSKIVVALSICLMFSQTCFAEKKIESAKENLKDVHNKIESLKKELNATQEAHQDASEALKTSETAISLTQKKLHDIELEQATHQNTLKQLKTQSLKVEQQLAQQQKQLNQQVYQQYLHNNQSYTQLILENKDLNSITRNLKYYAYIAKARNEIIANMHSNLDKIQALNTQTTETLTQIEQLKAEQVAEKQSLEQQKAEKAKVVLSLSSKISAQNSQIQKLKQDESNLSSLVVKLAQIAAAQAKKRQLERLAQIERQKERLAQQEKSTQKNEKTRDLNNNDDSTKESVTHQKNTVVAKSELIPDNDFAGINFSKLKGKLSLPIRGELINRFGSPRADTGMDWKGLFIKAKEGIEVRAIAAGQVVFADWIRGFGNLIIVDHGNGYMSLYGNNQALLKTVGQTIKGGDTIAEVGNSGGNEVNGLYYELRKNSVPFDPLSWSRLR